ncbi:MAG: hypothetical protein PHC46_04710, partial [Clostridia bacterium]|nr:hypothetical protein [Clostridia bacterium]
MTVKRKDVGDNETMRLLSEVEGSCPLCAKRVFEIVNNRQYKRYDVAHIYPLKPSDYEKELLKNEKKMSDDVESVDNKIALCKSCHDGLDNPRTIEEYRKLYNIKHKLIKKFKSRSIFKEFNLYDDISNILSGLTKLDDKTRKDIIEFKGVTVNKKLYNNLLISEVGTKVAVYYNFIEESFKSLNLSDKRYEILLNQVRNFYLAISEIEDDQLTIFEMM